MKTKKSSKKSLAFSLLSIIVSISMLIGITYAWFSASVTNENNKIKSGELSIALYADSVNVIDLEDPIYSFDHFAPNDNKEVVYEIINTGSLELNYVLKFQNLDLPVGAYVLGDVIDVYVDSEYLAPISRLSNGEAILFGSLPVGGSVSATVNVVFWKDAGNEYQNLSLDVDDSFDILLEASQINDDSFEAIQPDRSGIIRNITKTVKKDQPAVIDAGSASISLPEATVDDITNENSNKFTFESTVTKDDSGTFSVGTPEADVVTIDCKLYAGVNEIKKFKEAVTVSIYIAKGLVGKITIKCNEGCEDGAHDCSYDPATGLLEFKSTHFSSFTVVCKSNLVKKGESIQAAIDNAKAYDVIFVEGGVYKEDIVIEKPITLYGNNYKSNGFATNRVNETIITTPNLGTPWVYTATSADANIKIFSSDVKIAGFTVNGNNPEIKNIWTESLRDSIYTTTAHLDPGKTAFVSYNYLQTKLGKDIGVDKTSGIYITNIDNSETKNVVIENNVLANFWQSCLVVKQATANKTSAVIKGNSFSNCEALPTSYNNAYWGHYGQGITVNADAVVENNYLTNMSSGIQVQNNSASEKAIVKNNTLVNINSGIWLNQVNGLEAEVVNNNISFDDGYDKSTSYIVSNYYNNVAIIITTMKKASTIIIDKNNIKNYEYGIQIGNVQKVASLSISNTKFANIHQYCIGFPNTIMGYDMSNHLNYATILGGNEYGTLRQYAFEIGTESKKLFLTENGVTTEYPSVQN